jgi:hypothetical protein
MGRDATILKGLTMPQITSSMTRVVAASLTALTVFATAAWAQQSAMVRIRGTIEAVDG